MTDEASAEIGNRIQCLVTQLLQGGTHFMLGRIQPGLRELTEVSIGIAALRVFVEQQTGPVKLPPAARKGRK